MELPDCLYYKGYVLFSVIYKVEGRWYVTYSYYEDRVSMVDIIVIDSSSRYVAYFKMSYMFWKCRNGILF